MNGRGAFDLYIRPFRAHIPKSPSEFFHTTEDPQKVFHPPEDKKFRTHTEYLLYLGEHLEHLHDILNV